MSWLTSIVGKQHTDDDDTVLVVDRIACTGKGICAHLLPDAVELDEWGYPIIGDDHPEPGAARTAMSLCPTNALRQIRKKE